MLAIETGDTIRLEAQDLIMALRNKNAKEPINLTHQHNTTLGQLDVIFDTATRVDKQTASSPRVDTAVPRVKPSTLHDAYAQRVVAEQPQIKQNATRQNTSLASITKDVNYQLMQNKQKT